MAQVAEFTDVLSWPELEASGVFFTPSNTAKQNYMYLKSAGSARLTGDEVAERADLENHLLIYTHSGSGIIEYGDRRGVMCPGEGALLDCRQKIACRAASEEEWHFYWFNITGASIQVYYSQFAAARRNIFRVAEASEMENLLRRLAECAAQKGSTKSELTASTTIICILTELITGASCIKEERRAMPRYIEGIIEHINESYRKQITLDDLAAAFNVSKYHLSREFKKYTGYSPNEYVISVRISRAKELLRHTDRTIAEISQLTGSGDANHFIQLFKSREKLTPAAFRKKWDSRID